MGMTIPRKVLRLVLLALCLPLAGCSVLGLGVAVETGKVQATPPSDIIVYVTVQDGDEPVAQLSASEFQVYENDVLLNHEDIALRLLPREDIASGATVVLLDLSGDPDAIELKRISRGAAHFVKKVSTTQPVIVVAFDGSPTPRKVAHFSRVSSEMDRPLPELKSFITADSSRDLYGNLLLALQGLKAELSKEDAEFHFGTLVTVVRGPDLAGRKTESDTREALRNSGYKRFSLSPEEADIPLLSQIGAHSAVKYESLETLPLRFQDLGMRVRDDWYSHYLLSYCSPARAGERQLKVRVEFDNEEGVTRSGSSSSEFNADGFTGGCKPKESSSQETQPALSASAPSPSSEDDSPESTSTAAPPKPTAKKRQPKRVTPKKVEKSPDVEENEPVVAPPSSGKYE